MKVHCTSEHYWSAGIFESSCISQWAVLSFACGTNCWFMDDLIKNEQPYTENMLVSNESEIWCTL